MDIDLKFNTSELDSILNQLPTEIKRKVTRNSVRAGANIIRKRAEELAPHDESRQKGIHLRDALIVRRVKSTNDIFRVGVRGGKGGAPHGHLLEYGTVKMPAKPFLLPAFKNMKQEVIKRIVRNLGNGVLRESRKLAGK